jgi:hypothetical protein
MSFTDWLNNNLFSGAGDAASMAAAYGVSREGEKSAKEAGQRGYDLLTGVGKQASADMQFKPFGVTSSLANVQATPTGGLGVNLEPQQLGLQNTLFGSAGQLAGNLGGQYNPLAGQIGSNAYGQAQNFLGRAGQFDPSIAGQRGAVGGLFGQQVGGYGQGQDIQSLRSQYGGLAQQAGQGLMMSPEQRQGDIYESIRATQLPEEQRQNLALEERLLGQGRLGISTDAYGGTPEQLAMAKAQAEASNTASLMARQQAMAEGQQAMQNAQSLTGMTADLAQVGGGLESQQLQNILGLQGADQGAAGYQQQLQQGNFNLGQGMFGLGTQASQLPSQLQGMDIGNMQALMNAGYNPQQQALSMFGSGLQSSELAQRGQIGAAELQAQLGQSGAESLMGGEDLANRLRQQMLTGLLSTASGVDPTQGQGSALEELLKLIK